MYLRSLPFIMELMLKNYRELTYLVKRDDGAVTVRDIMKDRLFMSARDITKCKNHDDAVMCLRNGTSSDFSKVLLKDELYEGDKLVIKIYEDIENASEIVPSDDPIDVIYEDEDLIVVNKKGDVVVHPSYCHFTDSLSNALAGYYKRTGQEHVIRVIGRLDRETSGLLIFAKNRHSAALLSKQSTGMSRRKEYLALCSGVFSEKSGTIDAPIWENPKEKMIREVREDGKEAVTHYVLERQFEDFALVRLHLDTGRTHQIRVHMSYIGHPLLGDTLYGKEIENSHGMLRAALHATHLEFLQPITGQKLMFDADLPEDMQNIICS